MVCSPALGPGCSSFNMLRVTVSPRCHDSTEEARILGSSHFYDLVLCPELSTALLLISPPASQSLTPYPRPSADSDLTQSQSEAQAGLSLKLT